MLSSESHIHILNSSKFWCRSFLFGTFSPSQALPNLFKNNLLYQYCMYFKMLMFIDVLKAYAVSESFYNFVELHKSGKNMNRKRVWPQHDEKCSFSFCDCRNIECSSRQAHYTRFELIPFSRELQYRFLNTLSIYSVIQFMLCLFFKCALSLSLRVNVEVQ